MTPHTRTIGDVDLYLFNEGTHRRLWDILGAHPRTIDGVPGTAFAVWAPNAARVSVVGDFCEWNGDRHVMHPVASSGIHEIFVPGVGVGTLYKYEIRTRQGHLLLKADPMAQSAELAPGTASRVVRSAFTWDDAAWMTARRVTPHQHRPMHTYEVHLGSWQRVPEEGNRPMTYRELAPRLVEHARHFGFTHLELMPVAEHPFTGSWGYQVTGYYAPTARYGTPDDFRFFVDYCHRHGIGVIVDWVPAHFPKDAFALAQFDGTALYEHEDPRRGEHPDWGTLVFNFGRHEVRNFLVANALYWLDEFHVDGLRVDAVASMLYLDYSRKDGEWLPNAHGGRENLEAIDFLRAMNDAVREEYPGCVTIAEESTAWPGVTRSTAEGGLGFSFKWNMGWMHDTLEYMKQDPIHRRYHQDELSFAMAYEYSERFVMPLSHDEVVHGKGSLYAKMPGDRWQKLANLRLLLAYQVARPGKQLLFMGTELAQEREWNHDSSLDWHLADEPDRAAFGRFMARLGHLYQDTPPLWERDPDPEGFAWIDAADRENSVFSFVRMSGDDHRVVVLNCTPVPRHDYRIGAPVAGRYRVEFNTDAAEFGGSGAGSFGTIETEPAGCHGRPQSMRLVLPPLGVLILAPER